jgi:hypothetical protein
MFKLNSRLSADSRVDINDSGIVKTALRSLGYYKVENEDDFTPYVDSQLFGSIKKFQKDEKLKVDGIINPDGETHSRLKENIKRTEQSAGAFLDFTKNYFTLLKENVKSSDKYFHCKANFEAGSRGVYGEDAAKFLSNAHEYVDDLSGDSKEDSADDQRANVYGRKMARTKRYNSGRDACAPFRPKRGLDEKY